MDIAEIGLSVDTTEVQAATKALNDLADAAERVEKTLGRLRDGKISITVAAGADGIITSHVNNARRPRC